MESLAAPAGFPFCNLDVPAVSEGLAEVHFFLPQWDGEEGGKENTEQRHKQALNEGGKSGK